MAMVAVQIKLYLRISTKFRIKFKTTAPRRLLCVALVGDKSCEWEATATSRPLGQRQGGVQVPVLVIHQPFANLRAINTKEIRPGSHCNLVIPGRTIVFLKAAWPSANERSHKVSGKVFILSAGRIASLNVIVSI